MSARSLDGIDALATDEIEDLGEFNTDPPDGKSNEERYWQGPDC
jgi:hypothetical protein